MTTTFENNLLDLVTAVVMAPVAALYSLVCLIWQGCVLLWPYRRYIAQAAAALAYIKGQARMLELIALGRVRL